MGKDKLRKFAENLTFSCFVQPDFDDIFQKDHPLKGRWHRDFFGNTNPIVLELGCGKGEYTVALAERDPNRNYIGIDIKGARMWRGAKSATQREMKNVGFLRTRIEFINSFFAEGEIDEIWITFPDPQLKSRRAKKRLTAPTFLNYYAKMLSPEGLINLKTDSKHLFAYTAEVIRHFSLPVAVSNDDIYGSGYADEILSVKTAYETMFLQRGLPITYTQFGLDGQKSFEMFEWEGDDKLKDEKDNEVERIGLTFPTV
ncbi:MAG: tRNA (guanosine(46)-N7)-methyltransferase TrmB [Rikenellaceae bacterium]